MATALTTAQVATKLQTDARTLRKFLRSPDSTFTPVGQGKKYQLQDTDLPSLREQFKAWSDGKPRTRTGAPQGRPKRVPDRINPLDQDSLMTRTTTSIADRHRAHHIVCGFKQVHPVVKGLDFTCKQLTAPGTNYCREHAQLDWCGGEDEPIPGRCGSGVVKVPGLNVTVRSNRPFCKYHNGDLSEEEFDALHTQTP